MDRQKIIGDSILAVRDTIHVLQVWLGQLESWRDQGQAEPDEFTEACKQLKEAELWHWAQQAGGHGLEALARAAGVGDCLLNSHHKGNQR